MNTHQPHGNHTWNLFVHYDRCPICEYIFENREPFVLQEHVLKKELTCPQCQHSFTVIKKTRIAMKNRSNSNKG